MNANGFCFETEWPSAATRLKACLRRRKIPDSLIDDLVQETAIRLYKNWERVDPARGVWPLAVTVAMNIMKDQMRVEARRRDVRLPLLPMTEDPEAVALARVELERVREAMVQLPAAQRTALLAEIGESKVGDKSRAAIKMLRMRGRKRLRAMTQEASGLLGALELLIQRFLGRGSIGPLPVGAAACAPVAACVLTLGIIGPGHVARDLESLSRSPQSADATSELIDHLISPTMMDATGHGVDADGLWGGARSVRTGDVDGTSIDSSSPRKRSADTVTSQSPSPTPGESSGEQPVVPEDPLTVLPEEEGGGEPPSADVHEPEASTGSENPGFKTGASVKAAGHEGSVTVGLGSHGPEVSARLDGKELIAGRTRARG